MPTETVAREIRKRWQTTLAAYEPMRVGGKVVSCAV